MRSELVSFFEAHMDTPHSEAPFSSLVIFFPVKRTALSSSALVELKRSSKSGAIDLQRSTSDSKSYPSPPSENSFLVTLRLLLENPLFETNVGVLDFVPKQRANKKEGFYLLKAVTQ